LDYRQLALADKDNLYGCYDFYYACRDNGIKPIIGAELTTDLGNITLLCENHDSFKNLSRLITHYQLHGQPIVEILDKYRNNLICITSIQESSRHLRDIFENNLYIRLDYNQPSKEYRYAVNNGIKSVALPPVTFIDKHDFKKHRLLRAIDKGYLLSNLPDNECAHKETYFKNSEWYNHFYAPFEQACCSSKEIAERCHLVFPERKNILPHVKISGDHFEKLKQDVLNGLYKKKNKIPGTYWSRIEYELSVIQRTGFVDYFLIVGEIIDFCKREGITVVGRGSAAGSIVAYALSITQVDPIKENLYFERFLNEARSDCPDIDLDIDWRYRDDVLDFIYNRYGREHVAMIATYTRFQPRLALRESAKAMGIEPEKINTLAGRISSHPLERHTFPDTKSITLTAEEKRLLPVFKAARSIYGMPRHLGIHSGGIVITPEPLTNYIPLERASKGIVVTQCDMYQAEKIGLVKIDILGQRGLAVIADCLKTVRQTKGNSFEIPANDKKTFGTFQEGKTIGVLQVESPGLRALLKDLQPIKLNDIALALALIRPGASESGMKKVFLDRFHGLEKTTYPHPKLNDVLKETHGVFIYQEQVILAAQKIAGFNLPASDLLRRAITKGRKKNDRRKLKRRFLDGAIQNGVTENTAQDIFRQLRQFALFGFCKAHAVTYGHLAYQSAYFKTHYPDIFITAVLRNRGGYYPSAVYTAEARRMGIQVAPPDLNFSEKNDSLKDGKIYLGTERVRDITSRTLEQIEKAQPFVSLSDFLSRVDLSEREIENLIRVGFFDSLDDSRPKLLWQYRLFDKKRSKNDDLFSGKMTTPKVTDMPPLIPYSRYEVFKAEKDILEIPASFHPLTLFADYKPVNVGNLLHPDMIKLANNQKQVSLSGWLADRKKIKTQDGKHMVFLTFDSPDDTFEVVLFPDTYLKFREIIYKYRYLGIDGIINREGGNIAIIAENIYPQSTGLAEIKYI
jgi:DNA-directed DNA polymerase III PolC